MIFHKKHIFLFIGFLGFNQLHAVAQSDLLIHQNGYQTTLNSKGSFSYIGKKNTAENLLNKDSLSTLLRIQRFGQATSELPKKVTWKEINGHTVLKFDFNSIKVDVAMHKKQGYLSFEVVNINKENNIELLLWGKIHTILDQNVGQSIGVTYDDHNAIGLMGLNVKSSGGFEINHRERFGNAAQREKGGAVLQGYTRNRSKMRTDDNFIQELTNAAPLKDNDASLIGSKFALYTVSRNDLLNQIEQIEIQENLPHLTHFGEWIKKSLYSTSSKFIMSFNAQNIDDCLDIAQQAGISNVYHPAIFKTWGTYTLDPKAFPNGVQSVAECSDRAKARNMTLGAHTLSNFITTSDPLVTPRPHPNLQLAGITSLNRDLGKEDKTIYLNNSSVIKAYSKDELLPSKTDNNVNRNREIFAVRIGNEIIEYADTKVVGNIIELRECKRGAYGTTITGHRKNSPAGRLASYAYKVFFADINLQDTVATNLANFFNQAKLERISFDGVEGAVATGHNRYAGDRFVDVFFKNLKNKNIVANSSDVMHYAWHYFSNESWGEPWWAKNFRESQLDHRLAVQQALKEDLLPRKMGQFSIKENTTLKDINWVMGLCAGYDNGVDFYVSPKSIKANPEGPQILKTIKKWETIRMKQTLSAEQKEKLRDVFTLYKLEGTVEQPQLRMIETWAPESGQLQKENDRNTLPNNLITRTESTTITYDYRHHSQVTEPGMPTHSEFEFTSTGKDQPIRFVVRVAGNAKENIEGLCLKSGTKQIDVPFILNPGDYIVLDKDAILKRYNTQGTLLASNKISSAFEIKKGKNTILIDYRTSRDKAGPEVILNIAIDK